MKRSSGRSLHQMRELSGLRRRFVPYVLGPAIGPVDDIEQPPTHDHGTGGRDDLFEDLGVDRVLLGDPGVELVDVSERNGMGFYVYESVSHNQDGAETVRGTWTNIVRGV